MYANGDVYEGAWHNDAKHGQGIMHYANGNIYEGPWVADERHGEGAMEFGVGDPLKQQEYEHASHAWHTAVPI